LIVDGILFLIAYQPFVGRLCGARWPRAATSLKRNIDVKKGSTTARSEYLDDPPKRGQMIRYDSELMNQ
jgi:hypothetical protein